MDRLANQDISANFIEGLSVRPLGQDPQSFALGLAHLVRNYTFQYLSTKGDVLGGLSAAQYGLVAVQARSALERGVDIFIGWKTGLTPTDSTRMNLLKEASEIERTVEQGQTLLLANPIEDHEVIEYAYACFEFIEGTLGLKPPLTSMGHGTKEERAKYDADSLEIARLTRHLGINSPYTGSRFDEKLKAEEAII